MPSTFRRSQSGRLVVPRYTDETPYAIIANTEDERDVEDQVRFEQRRKIKEIEHFVHSMGYKSIFDVCLDQWGIRDDKLGSEPECHIPSNVLKVLLRQLGIHSKAQVPSTLSDEICELAERIFRKEVEQLHVTPELRRPLKSYQLSDIREFSFSSCFGTITQTAPRLSRLLRNLFFLNVLNDNDEEEGDRLDGESLSDEDKYVVLKREKLIMHTAISALLYGRSTRINRFQGQMSYFLVASKTPKTVMAILQRLGICLPYESTAKFILPAIAQASRAELKQWTSTLPACLPVFDNADYYSRVRDQRLDNQTALLHRTVGFVAVNPVSASQSMFSRHDINEMAISEIDVGTFYPKPENLKQQRLAFEAGLYDGLNKYFKKELAAPNGAGHRKLRLSPFKFPTVYQIPVQKSKVFSLPAWDFNEAKISEMTQLLRKIMEELGYGEELLREKLVMIGGDQLTVRNIRYRPA